MTVLADSKRIEGIKCAALVHYLYGRVQACVSAHHGKRGHSNNEIEVAARGGYLLSTGLRESRVNSSIETR